VSVPGLGPLESAIMTAMWDAGKPLAVRTCRDRLDYESRDGDPAYSTVATVMTNLAGKRLLARVKAGHTWSYAAQVSREEYAAALIREALACVTDPAAVLILATAGLPALAGG
jgi:predicted transcriptional regulator